MLGKKGHALNSETFRSELRSPEGRGEKALSEYAWVSWNLFQSIYSQSTARISAGTQLPAPSNYLQPSTTWPLPSPMVAPSNVGPHFKVGFFLLPDHALSTSFLRSHNPGKGYDTGESPHSQQRWYRPVSTPRARAPWYFPPRPLLHPHKKKYLTHVPLCDRGFMSKAYDFCPGSLSSPVKDNFQPPGACS